MSRLWAELRAISKAQKNMAYLASAVKLVDPPILMPDGRFCNPAALWDGSDCGNAHGRAVTLDG